MAEAKKVIKIGMREKIVLLGLQVVLPFVLYLAIEMDSMPLGIGAGVILVLSMLALVLLG